MRGCYAATAKRKNGSVKNTTTFIFLFQKFPCLSPSKGNITENIQKNQKISKTRLQKVVNVCRFDNYRVFLDKDSRAKTSGHELFFCIYTIGPFGW